MEPSEQPPSGRRAPLPARLLGIGARAGERVAAATGIDDAVETATEEAIVRALESPAVERAIVRVLESDAAQESFERTLSSPAVERAAVRILDSDLVDHAWDRLLASDEAQKLVERIAEAPEVRAAIAAQGVGLISDTGRQIGKISGRLDDAVERLFRRLIGRPRKRPASSVGLVTRLLGFGLDLAILNGIFLVAAAALTALLGDADQGISGTGVIFGAAAWIGFGSFYLLTFWSLVGQTPGMRFLSIRIEHEGSRVLGRRVARRRLVGAVLAMIPFGLGYLGLLTRDDRRAFHDRHADTVVVRVDRVAAPWSTPSTRE
ncbi:MAG TPA: RDD family protein [Candidatus Limnocylindrales bacterium]|nr:RDD family protein [Candidatus Limnocylindrales bacterium]